MIVRERDKIRQIRLWLKARIESSVPFQDDTSSRKRHQTLGCAVSSLSHPRDTLARCDCALAILLGRTCNYMTWSTIYPSHTSRYSSLITSFQDIRSVLVLMYDHRLSLSTFVGLHVENLLLVGSAPYICTKVYRTHSVYQPVHTCPLSRSYREESIHRR
jgi:hypothetical protein